MHKDIQKSSWPNQGCGKFNDSKLSHGLNKVRQLNFVKTYLIYEIHYITRKEWIAKNVF